MNDYYKSNLDKIGSIQYSDSIKISFNGKETNYFAVNEDSLKALKQWVNTIEKNINKETII